MRVCLSGERRQVGGRWRPSPGSPACPLPAPASDGPSPPAPPAPQRPHRASRPQEVARAPSPAGRPQPPHRPGRRSPAGPCRGAAPEAWPWRVRSVGGWVRWVRVGGGTAAPTGAALAGQERDWLSQSKQGERPGPEVRECSSLLQPQDWSLCRPTPSSSLFPPSF